MQKTLNVKNGNPCSTDSLLHNLKSLIKYTYTKENSFKTTNHYEPRISASKMNQIKKSKSNDFLLHDCNKIFVLTDKELNWTRREEEKYSDKKLTM